MRRHLNHQEIQLIAKKEIVKGLLQMTALEDAMNSGIPRKDWHNSHEFLNPSPQENPNSYIQSQSQVELVGQWNQGKEDVLNCVKCAYLKAVASTVTNGLGTMVITSAMHAYKMQMK